IDHGLVDLAQSPHIIRAHVKESGAVVLHSEDAGRYHVLRIDELVAIAAVAYHPDFSAVLNELEENGEQAEPSTVDDGRTAQDHDPQAVGIFCQQLLGGKL